MRLGEKRVADTDYEGDVWIYKGELDLDGNVFGIGQSYEEKSPEVVFGGSFVNERHHGIGTERTDEYFCVKEVKDRELYGKSTMYYSDGRIYNSLKTKRIKISSTPEDAFYKGLKANTALNADLKNYKSSMFSALTA